VQLKASLRGYDYETQVQMLSPNGPQDGASSVQAAADKGISGSSGALPHASTIQQSFGGYDISNIQAHLGPAADAGAAAMGAQAYATGNHVAFASGSAGLHTAAHEAAHVVQQKEGVSLSGGVGQAGDKYETHADDVADLVVQGKSAEGLLGEMSGGGGGGGVVQRQEPPREMVDSSLKEDERPPLTLEGGGVDFEGEIGLSFDNIITHRNAIYRNQMEACATLAETAGKKDPPSLLQDAITLAVEIALVAATAGIGASVALGVTSRLTSLAVDAKRAENVIKIVADVAKDSAKAMFKKVGQVAPGKVSAAMTDYPESEPERAAKVCFMAQRSALIAGAHDAEISYNLGKALLKGTGEAGLKAAQALESSLSAQIEPAKEVQRTKSIQEWANYQARAG